MTCDELGMLTGQTGLGGNEQGTAKALGQIAVGLAKLEGRRHAQARPTPWCAIRITRSHLMAMRVEGNSANAATMSHRLRDVPEVIRSISGDMGGQLIGRSYHTLVERTGRGDIGFIEGQRVLGEHD